jgi:flavin-dependent dehydrogenase
VGGGPAGSLFAYFLLDMASRAGFRPVVDIYEFRDFDEIGRGCNMCGGIISESLVQSLVAEGIDLPPTVVQRGIDSYVLHMDVGSVRIETPLREQRIAAVHRGAGPRDLKIRRWESFDQHLLMLASGCGARIVRKKVTNISRENDRIRLTTAEGPTEYELAAVAVGVNSGAAKFLEGCDVGYRAPGTTKTFIREYFLGEETIAEHIGSSMHVFLLDIPRIEFAAVIPKGDYATVCLLGDDIDASLVRTFLDAPQLRSCFPDSWDPDAKSCQCTPRINVRGSTSPFGDRVVFVGDSGVTRLYKDGIGAAYRTAKAAATTAAFHGVGEGDFARHFAPRCRAILADNRIGKLTFGFTRVIQKSRPARRAVWSMVQGEQRDPGDDKRMSQVLWDLFTGSATYRSVLERTLRPGFVASLVKNLVRPVAVDGEGARRPRPGTGLLGAIYDDGDVIVRQGEPGDAMYLILDGEATVSVSDDGHETELRTIGPGELFGEMAIFDRVERSATVRARGRVRALTIEKRTLLPRIQEDPSLAFHIIQNMSTRIRDLSRELAQTRR